MQASSRHCAIYPEVGDLSLHSRRHRLRKPKGFAGRCLIVLKDLFESALAIVSKVPDVPVYDNALFPWAAEFEAHWLEIRAELEEILKERAEMPSFHEVLSQVSSITQDDQWKTFFLVGPGMDCTESRKKCPRTAELLDLIPDLKTAMFSILSPHKLIPPHRGPYNGVLRYHLGLLMPEPREKCRIRIATRTYLWEEGQSLIFDDTYNHEVWNETDGYRVVLFLDFARPLYFPFHQLNLVLMKLAERAPFLRAARDRYKKWEETHPAKTPPAH